MTLTMEKVEAIKQKLRELPPAPKKERKTTKASAVKEMRAEIEALRKKGYSFQQIAEILTGDGMEISMPTLKSYIQRAKQKTKKGTTKRTKKTLSDALKKDASHKPSSSSFTVIEDTPDI